jgi:hypothetical protein
MKSHKTLNIFDYVSNAVIILGIQLQVRLIELSINFDSTVNIVNLDQ